ncbi:MULTISPECIES: helix-turn-helix domain-containing protein [Paenibacillus]|uniref:Helix-turn-helix domain-containing protein n=1 Tax=Paenibacillus campinasensis TaxID=66347 RepID=A0ABW9SZ23_9BACL|nr:MULTISPECIES: helix-turn-helix domain-containing protein [Paenibacillus]MUG65180.1 helix-turn-helix domain-containing protein [Paenibacillus campinasensis]PAK52267.1 AraC family transcriptional regulator [Paenibacillus sp. 7541]
MIRQRLFRYAVYRNMFLSFVLLTAAMIALVTVVLFVLFSWSTAKEVGKISESMLKQNSAVSSVIREQVYNVGNLLLSDQEIVNALLDKEATPLKQYGVFTKLGQIQSTYPFIHSIGIYNGSTHSYLNTKGITLEEEEELLGEINSKNASYFQLFRRQLSMAAMGKGKEDVLTFVLLPSYYSPLSAKGAIVINMSTSGLQDLIGGYRNEAIGSLYVIDDHGNVMTHSEETSIDNLSEEPYVQTILASDKESGYFTKSIDGRKSIVTYVKSKDLNWIFMSVNKYQNVLFNMQALKQAALGLAFACFAISILLSFWLTNNAYNPIRQLLEKMTSISKSKGVRRQINEFDLLDTTYAELTEKMRSMESEASLARQALVLRLLKGGDERMFQRLVEHSQGVCFVAIAILLDSEDGLPAGDEEGRKSYSCAAISRLAQQVLESEGASVAAVEEGTAAVILPLKHQHLPIHLVGMLEDLQGEIARTLGLSVTIGIGSVAENYDELRESFRYAQSCFRQRFFEGKGKVFHCDPLVVEEDSQTEAIYPDKREKRIVEAIKLQQLDKLEKEIDLWVKDIRGYSYHEVMFFINQFIGGLYKQLNVHSVKNRESAELFLEFTRDITRFETLQETAAALKELAVRICSLSEESGAVRHAEVVDFIQAYVQQHYSRPDMSLEQVAGEVKLSRSYVGKLFKAHCELSFNDYLNAVRLEKAKELLTTTEESVQSISEQVGIMNTTYFYTLFKKHYQISPAQFRSQHAIAAKKAQ